MDMVTGVIIAVVGGLILSWVLAAQKWGWGWLRLLGSALSTLHSAKESGGKVDIGSPLNRDPVPPGWVRFVGTHEGVPRNTYYWLIGRAQDGYWPHTPIDLKETGEWVQHVNISDQPGPRAAIVLLVRVSPEMHSILSCWKERNRAEDRWRPFNMSPPAAHFVLVDTRELLVQAGVAPNQTRF